MSKNIYNLLSAYLTTEDVFQERGYGKGNVNLIKYLKDGDLTVFTSTNGARDLIASIDFDELTNEIKSALIDGTIYRLVENQSNLRSNINNIPQTIYNWAIDQVNGEAFVDFKGLYRQLLRNENNNLGFVDTLNLAKRYLTIKDKIQYLEKESEIAKIIEVLEYEKEKLNSIKSKEGNSRK